MSAIASIASATFNAFAFAGAGFLFSKINKGDYQAEMKRHNLAIEKLQKDHEKSSESRLQELDRVQKLHYDRQQADRDIAATNKDFDLVKKLNLVKEQYQTTEPKLESYYKPSSTMQEYMTAVKFLATIPVLYGVVSLI